MARTFPGKKKQSFRVEGGLSMSQLEQISIEKGKLGLLTPGPCQRCNNGWMSEMENRTKALLLPLMRGVRTDLSIANQSKIAIWTTKTAMTFDYHEHTKRQAAVYFSQVARD